MYGASSRAGRKIVREVIVCKVWDGQTGAILETLHLEAVLVLQLRNQRT